MKSPLVISARNAGQVELETYCPRCCWYLLRIKRWPYQFGMPGIMFYMEQAEKAFVSAYMKKYKRLPKTLAPFSDCIEAVEFPFSMKHEHSETGVIFTARPDMLWRRPDQSLALIDLKTSKPDGGGKVFLPQYEIQVIGYSWVTNAEEIGEVTAAGIVYTDIQVGAFAENPLSFGLTDGFTVPFRLEAHEVPLDFKRLTRCLKEVKSLWNSARPPQGRTGCRDCKLLTQAIDFENDLRLTDRYAAQYSPDLIGVVISQDYFRRIARGLPDDNGTSIQDYLGSDKEGGHWATWEFSEH